MKVTKMMHVQKYLREFGIEKLQSEFAIKVKQYDEGLIVLNYDQILSIKTHPIVMECRGLILDSEFNVVSISFSRFFNYGEAPETQSHIDWNKATLIQKIDGSLIRIFFWNDKWNIATRGTTYAESTVNGFDITFKELVLKALNMTDEEFQVSCDELFSEDQTIICEITSVENRVVRAYTGYTLHYLAGRNNKTLEYVNLTGRAKLFGMSIPQQYSFSSIHECLEVVENLKNLDEGFVLYQDGIPVCKLKSPAYVAVHLIRGEGLSPKRIAELVLTNEQEEYLTYFPEDRAFIQPYALKLNDIIVDMSIAYEDNRGIESQKDFARAIKNVKGSSVLFTSRKLCISVYESWKQQSDSFRLRVLLEEMK